MAKPIAVIYTPKTDIPGSSDFFHKVRKQVEKDLDYQYFVMILFHDGPTDVKVLNAENLNSTDMDEVRQLVNTSLEIILKKEIEARA